MSRLSLLNDSGRRAPRWPGACLVLLTSHPAPCAAAIFISSREDSSREERLFSRPVPISQAAPGARRPRDADNSDRIQSTGFIDGTELPKKPPQQPTYFPPAGAPLRDGTWCLAALRDWAPSSSWLDPAPQPRPPRPMPSPLSRGRFLSLLPVLPVAPAAAASPPATTGSIIVSARRRLARSTDMTQTATAWPMVT